MTDEQPTGGRDDQHEAPAGGKVDPDCLEVDQSHGETARDPEAQSAAAGGEPVSTPPPGTGAREIANQAVLGTLYVYTTSRDISLVLDGEAALRFMSAFRHGAQDRSDGDVLDPTRSSAEAIWAVLDLGPVLAMYWLPGLPDRGSSERVTAAPLPA